MEQMNHRPARCGRSRNVPLRGRRRPPSRSERGGGALRRMWRRGHTLASRSGSAAAAVTLLAAASSGASLPTWVWESARARVVLAQSRVRPLFTSVFDCLWSVPIDSTVGSNSASHVGVAPLDTSWLVVVSLSEAHANSVSRCFGGSHEGVLMRLPETLKLGLPPQQRRGALTVAYEATCRVRKLEEGRRDPGARQVLSSPRPPPSWPGMPNPVKRVTGKNAVRQLGRLSLQSRIYLSASLLSSSSALDLNKKLFAASPARVAAVSRSPLRSAHTAP